MTGGTREQRTGRLPTIMVSMNRAILEIHVALPERIPFR